jgi:hypothetical protein
MSSINNTFLNNQSTVSMFNFPSKEQLQIMLYEQNFNFILLLIREEIVKANSKNKKMCVISDIFGNFDTSLIEDVRVFLVNKEYKLSLVKDNRNVITSWVIYWS